MFLSCSHFNVSSFLLNVSATTLAIRTSCELTMSMFLRRCDYVLAPLQLPVQDGRRGSFDQHRYGTGTLRHGTSWGRVPH